MRSLRAEPECTDNKTGRQVLRYFQETYVDRVRSYRGTFPFEKALRKRRVWVEPISEAELHEIRRIWRTERQDWEELFS